MGYWILILTIFNTGPGGAAIHHIEFQGKAGCVAVADAWMADLRKNGRDRGASALCVAKYP